MRPPLHTISNDYKQNNGFTLIELLFVIAIIGVLASLGLAMYQKRAVAVKVNKTALQIQQLLQAGTAYYIDHQSQQEPWPTNINQQDFQPYKPFGNDSSNSNPWGYQYSVEPAPDSDNKRFQATVQVPSVQIAKRVAAELPNAEGGDLTTGEPVVSAQVTIPGFSNNNESGITIAGIGYATDGSSIEAVCPPGKRVQFFLSPSNLKIKTTEGVGNAPIGDYQTSLSNCQTIQNKTACTVNVNIENEKLGNIKEPGEQVLYIASCIPLSKTKMSALTY